MSDRSRFFRLALRLLGLSLMLLAVAASPSQGWQAPPAADRYVPTAAELGEIEARTTELGKALALVREKVGDRLGLGGRDAIADVEVCHKSAVWVVRHGEFFEAKDVARTLKVLAVGLARARDLEKGQTPWADVAGGVTRGYRSKVDGSIQPYAVVVPPNQGADDRLRLDVVLHGRDARASEVRFFDAHDAKLAPKGQLDLVLHVFGRTNNAYRWAGETDVHEAIDAVKRNYRVDDRRVVLRGFSMGGAGAWHMALHDPSRWSSAEAGAGFTETIRYAKLVNPSETILKGLHIYDSVDYAINAYNVPIVGYGGENDPQAQASKNIVDALSNLGVAMKTEGLVTKAEGLDFQRIVGKGMGHAVDPSSASLMKTFHDERASKPVDPYPRKIRFATYTLKYNKVGWLEIERLTEHYRRTTLEAETDGDVAMVKTENVAVLAVARGAGETIRLDGQEFPLREAVGGLLPDVYFRKLERGWEQLDHDGSRAIEENTRREKRPGVQGPIDDAFAAPFLCVRGTGEANNAKVQAWAEARLQQFAEVWNRSMRGDLPIKNDVDVTEQDIETNHLVLFGDPGSNRLIARVLPSLMVSWDARTVALHGEFSAVDHVPVLISVNPLNSLRYVVINSGHTFGAEDFRGTNALLYPRLGDHAVIKIGSPDEVKVNEFYDEKWK